MDNIINIDSLINLVLKVEISQSNIRNNVKQIEINPNNYSIDQLNNQIKFFTEETVNYKNQVEVLFPFDERNEIESTIKEEKILNEKLEKEMIFLEKMVRKTEESLVEYEDKLVLEKELQALIEEEKKLKEINSSINKKVRMFEQTLLEKEKSIINYDEKLIKIQNLDSEFVSLKENNLNNLNGILVRDSSISKEHYDELNMLISKAEMDENNQHNNSIEILSILEKIAQNYK